MSWSRGMTQSKGDVVAGYDEWEMTCALSEGCGVRGVGVSSMGAY